MSTSNSVKKQTNGNTTAKAPTAYVNGNHNPMDRGPNDYSQPDPASAAQYSTPSQEVRGTAFPPSATPNSEYGLNPSSARSDPNIAAVTSPTYPPSGHQYSPYPPGHDMSAYQGHPSAAGMYNRPDWSQYPQGHAHGLPGPYGAHPSPTTTVSSASSAAPAGGRGGQVYSFVPIPGAQQHKRPRRRYEEIERMYKCGWNGCEKAYGTLNHLNAHVTMQSHGSKRTPEEFKEIRKEWKQRKKDEDNARKAEDERIPPPPPNYSTPSRPGPGSGPQLPPIAYQGGPPPGQGQYAPQGMPEQMPQQSYDRLYPNYPPSPYGQGGQVYQQHPDVPSVNYPQ